MKKHIILLLPLLVLSTLSTTSCSENKTNSPLIISEYLEGDGANKAIELYNISNKEIDLSDYSISIYISEGKETNISLEGIIKPKETFVLVNSSSSQELLEKADQTASFLYVGKQPISLKRGSKTLDIVGYANNTSIDYGADVVLVRKTNYFIPRIEFDEYDWIRYLPNEFQYLGNIDNSVTEEELLAGPKLTDDDLSKPYYKMGTNGYVGNGGVVDVKMYKGVDGDTTIFTYPNEFVTEMNTILPSNKQMHNNSTKVRYQGIDTPESYTGNIQEFGIPAKFFTTGVLEQATDIKVQSVNGSELIETFGRLLGWVWADGTLVNFLVVKNGYSKCMFEDVETMSYKGVTYTNYLYNIQLYAEKQKVGVWGEKDPYWDYTTNKSTYTGYTGGIEDN